MQHIMIMDDDKEFLELFQRRLALEGFEVSTSQDCINCVSRVKEKQPQLVFLDIDFGEGQNQVGLNALRALREHWSSDNLPVIMLSGVGDSRVLVNALKSGATDYFFKPIEDFSALIDKIGKIIKDASRESKSARNLAEAPLLHGASPTIMKINREIIKSAQGQQPTFFRGETGTGKEIAAKMYHCHSPRKSRSMITINCPNFPGDQFEAQVYGYKKGAFTGADRDKKGLAEEADKGIIFFDEIGKLPLPHQAKLLRFIEDMTFTPLGSNEEKKVDVIILAATNENLEALVEKKEFLEDLYYRLDKNILHLPPLAGREQDIAYLADYFFRKYNFKNIETIEQEVIEVLKKMRWKGNVRQLENCIRKSIHRCEGNILTLEYVEGNLTGIEKQSEERNAAEDVAFQDMNYADFKQYEKTRIAGLRRAFYSHHLKQHAGNITKTAATLGMTKEFLRQIMVKYDIRHTV